MTPEYNGSYPGLLKHALDTLMREYPHKSVGLATVAAGGLGGVRLVPTILPVLKDLGLVTIRRDLAVSRVAEAFDENGMPTDDRLEARAGGFIDELLWMTRALKAGREHGGS